MLYRKLKYVSSLERWLLNAEVGAELISRCVFFHAEVVMHVSWVRRALNDLGTLGPSSQERTCLYKHLAPLWWQDVRWWCSSLSSSAVCYSFHWWRRTDCFSWRASVLQYDSWALLWTVGILYFITPFTICLPIVWKTHIYPPVRTDCNMFREYSNTPYLPGFVGLLVLFQLMFPFKMIWLFPTKCFFYYKKENRWP